MKARGSRSAAEPGHWSPPPGTTRYDAFNELRRAVNEQTPALANATVISFDIKHNHLEAD